MDCLGISQTFANRKKSAALKQAAKQQNLRIDQEHKLVHSCQQLQLIQGRIQLLQARHERAVRSGHMPLAHSLKLQLMTMHGVYEAYQKYAIAKREQLMETYVEMVKI